MCQDCKDACVRCDHVSHDVVRLWDGRQYCHDCMEAACPGMVAYARDHAVLEETMPYSRWQMFRKFMAVMCAWLLLFVAIASAAIAILVEDPAAAVWHICMVAGLILVPGIPIAAIFSFTVASQEHTYRSTVALVRGELRVKYGYRVFDVLLDDCRCNEGGFWRVNSLPRHSAPVCLKYPVLLIAVLDYAEGDWRNRIIAVGYSPEKFRIWKGLFSLREPSVPT